MSLVQEIVPGTRPSPPSWVGGLRRRLLGVSVDKTDPHRRGFRVDDAASAEKLAKVGQTFLIGYHSALEETEADSLAAALNRQVPPGWRGWAYEGAGMGLTMLDLLLPGPGDRLGAFLRGPAAPHDYLVHVGAGWCLAKLPISVDRLFRRLDPSIAWLAVDGFGFHQGFFAAPQAVRRKKVPRRLRGYARRAFDQGLGRSLWFVEGMNPVRIAVTIRSFPEARQNDLWGGVGLACGYAGGVGKDGVRQLQHQAAQHAASLGQGAAFAVEARLQSQDLAEISGLSGPSGFSGPSGLPTQLEQSEHLAMVGRILCLADLSTISSRVRESRPSNSPIPSMPEAVASPMSVAEPAYEGWRLRIRSWIQTRLAQETLP